MIRSALRWLGRLFADAPTSTRALLDQLDQAALDEQRRAERLHFVSQANTAHGAPPRREYTPDPAPVLYAVDPIAPGSPLALFNAADPGCVRCGGMGRISQCDSDGTVRAWTPCPCTAGRDQYGEPIR